MPTPSPTCRCATASADAQAATLDLRGLVAPEPMQRAIAAAEALRPGQSIDVLTPLIPMPLLAALAERGWQAQVVSLPEGGARVTIRRPIACGCDDPAGA